MKRRLMIIYFCLIYLVLATSTASARRLVLPTVEVSDLVHEYKWPEDGHVKNKWEFSGKILAFKGYLADYDEIQMRLSAPAGTKFLVELPDEVSQTSLWIDMTYRYLNNPDMSVSPDSQSVVLENLTGGPVVQDYLFVWVGVNGHVIECTAHFTIQGSCEFTAARFDATYRDGLPGPRVFKAYDFIEGDLSFLYPTDSIFDPGPFVSIVLQDCSGNPPMDFNGDCIVNFADFAIFASHWLDDNFDP